MSMPSPTEHYREKAIELRKLASGMTAPNAQKEFETIAKLYDRLAEQIEGALDERRHQSAAH
jgi:hypothetical protein